MAQWIQDLAAQRKALGEKLDTRKGLMIPSEDRSREDIDEPSPPRPDPAAKRSSSRRNRNPALGEGPGGGPAARRHTEPAS
jgi:hypothetical protein